MSALKFPEGVEGEFSSRRIFMPPPQFPKRAQTYRDMLDFLGLHMQAHKLALAHLHLQAGESVLDAGCGTGYLALELKRRWPNVEVEGVDHDVDALQMAAELAEQTGAHVLFQKGYMQDLPCSAERYDVVVCLLLLHRLRGAERGAAFQELIRVLKPGGRLLFVDFGAPARGMGGWLVKRLAEYERGISDHLELGLEELCRLGGLLEVAKAGQAAFGLRAVTALRP